MQDDRFVLNGDRSWSGYDIATQQRNISALGPYIAYANVSRLDFARSAAPSSADEFLALGFYEIVSSSTLLGCTGRTGVVVR